LLTLAQWEGKLGFGVGKNRGFGQFLEMKGDERVRGLLNS
jgi:hypothetical protein